MMCEKKFDRKNVTWAGESFKNELVVKLEKWKIDIENIKFFTFNFKLSERLMLMRTDKKSNFEF